MEYIYNNFTAFNIDKLHFQVQYSDMTDKSIEYCSWNESDQILKVIFTNELSSGDKAILDYLVGNHTTSFPEADFDPEIFLGRLAEEFDSIERLDLSKSAPSFIIELHHHNFAEIKLIRDYLVSNSDITQLQADTITNLFAEQNINLDNY